MEVNGITVPTTIISQASLAGVLLGLLARILFQRPEFKVRDVIPKTIEDFGLVTSLFTIAFTLGAAIVAVWRSRSVVLQVAPDSASVFFISLLAGGSCLLWRLVDEWTFPERLPQSTQVAVVGPKLKTARRVVRGLIAGGALAFTGWGSALAFSGA